ncbi:TetR/AcrR family transcriptional regulator [Staphylospora marina]|uniref:TetR/AcrR family transcriptional regulator n=1 Tax=Staphylospora marina TaxID=2490858 RepID=UPI0013DDEFD6|nr:TetR/AcrR family transcriptional regulator [Staphylospora marina]
MKYKSGERTQARIIEAAFRVIAEKGYDAMTIDDVMSEIGKTKGSFYVHFQSKEDLLHQLMKAKLDREYGGIAEKTLKELEKPDCNIREVISRILEDCYKSSGGSDPGVWAQSFYQVFLMHRKNEYVREWMKKQYEMWDEFLEMVIRRGQELGQIRDDIDPKIIATLIVATFQGYEIRSTVDKDLNFFEQEQLYQLFYT